MRLKFYLRRGTVYIPTVSKTEAGYYLDIEPVSVVPANDADALRRAVRETVSRGNPIVPTPPRDAFPKFVVLKHANVKSSSAFERGTQFWRVLETDGSYQIRPGRPRSDRGWEDDPERAESFPAGTPLDVVVERMATLLRDAHT